MSKNRYAGIDKTVVDIIDSRVTAAMARSIEKVWHMESLKSWSLFQSAYNRLVLYATTVSVEVIELALLRMVKWHISYAVSGKIYYLLNEMAYLEAQAGSYYKTCECTMECVIHYSRYDH